ncbi:hypothetical protein [Tunicatimonas pelagia]|uniref:hypothetical protein n=1 Tax=Tunicatimonas pelagia TaxID=931531 RepID=UPI002665DD73|nr:hypothetical protein [Tunicatimonas pelagia]WKN41598.1 hypothetical protein P0M28_21415 [Tunicatimonas pelagia]
MHKLTTNLLTLISIAILFSGCEYICDCEDDGPEPCAFSYENIVYTPNGAPGDQLISPIFDGDIPEGSFSATPAGLVIDTVTGAIDVNASEFGKEYNVSFRIKDSEVVCETNIFIDNPADQTCELNYETSVIAPGEKDFLAPFFANGYVPDGKFSAYPSGLDISPDKGIVSVSTSTSGVQYFITYISNDKKTICQTTLLITGVDYPERIIDLNAGDTVLSPYFNEQGGEEGRTFGEYRVSPADLAFADGTVEPGVSISDGDINILETIRNQDPEELFPEEGFFSKDYTITYLLSNAENALSIELRLYYFPDLATLEELAPELLEAIEDREQYIGNGRIEKKPRYCIAIGDALN